jgi:glycosyltransferase involved in cell wall biosynthesis
MADSLIIAIDARMILPKMTGVGRYLLGLAAGLRTLPEDDYCYEFWLQPQLSKDHPIWGLENDRLKLHRLTIPHMDYRQQWILPAEIRRRKPDLLHYPHFDLPFAVSGPVVATIHDLKYIARPDFFPTHGIAKKLLIKIMTSFTARRASRVITDSQSTRQDLIQYLKIEPGKVVSVPAGVGEKYFIAPSPTSLQFVRRRYHLPDSFILFVGERRPHKNIPGLIRAFEIFSRDIPRPYHLVVVGKRYSEYREPEQLVEALGLNGKVHFLDHVPDDDLYCLYHIADVFVLLSFYEGFGLPALEAMASRAPVVAARASSLPEVIGDAGLLVEPDNPEQVALAIRQVVPGGEHREELIAKGLERSHQFTWERCAQETIAVYREALTS